VPASPPGDIPGAPCQADASAPRPSETVAQRRSGIWNLILLPTVLFLAGLLFAASARTSSGTDLRGGRHNELRQLVTARSAEVKSAERRVAELQDEIDTATQNHAKSDARLRQPAAEAEALKNPVGLVAVAGPGITVRMDDAPGNDSGSLPHGAGVDDVVVHQQDVQAVVNALWTGGAEAMTIMGERVIATTAVRCVGNTLLLHGRTFSPPFVIRAIGSPSQLSRALERSTGVQLFQAAAKRFHLGFSVTVEPADIRLPAYQGSVSLSSARSRSR
jgi:uncharacterized protein YlxW (UPF0749 family)